MSISRGQLQGQEQLPPSGQEVIPQQPATLTQPSETSGNNTDNSTRHVPILNDSKLQVELVTGGLSSPTSMAFIGNHGDLLILEKNGNAIFFSNQSKSKVSLLNFTVNHIRERGLLGVAALDNISISLSTPPQTFVFFYLTEASNEDRSQVLGNRIYRFEWNDTDKSLSNGTLILDLPATPSTRHIGGKLIADSKNRHLYTVIGDLDRNGMLQNFKNGSLPDDTSVIIRINPDGSSARDNPFLNVSGTDASYANLSKYYAYGIRNSFGLAIDPITGILWETENGPQRMDEINFVRPGFNSGWEAVRGPIERRNVTVENDLVNFLNSSSYANPVLSWGRAVGLSDIEFYNSDNLGDNYTNNIFVGDFNNGNLYFFEVNATRSGLKFDSPRIANDLVLSNDRQRASVIFGTGFANGITDIETGPDGYLYVLTYHQTDGALYRIVPQKQQ
jgi:aldose sugar dehydrogenase